MCSLVAAGVEGGSKRAIEDEWDLRDVAAQHEYWKRHGPPLNITAVVIASALGAKLIDEPERAPGALVDLQPDAPTLADMRPPAPITVFGAVNQFEPPA